MKVNGKNLTDDEVDKRLGRQYRKILALHAAGASDHPCTIPSGEWAEIIRGTRDNVAAQDGPADPHARNRAHDEALGGDGTQSMAEAFPGFDRVGLKFPVPRK